MKKTALILYGATDFGAPHFSSDILWRTGFRAPDPFFLVEIGGKAFLLVSSLEIGRARKEARGARAVLYDAFAKRGEQGMHTHGLVGFLKACGTRKVIIPHGFPHGIARILEWKFCMELHEGAVFPARIRKSKDEIAEIARVQRAAENALTEALKVLGASKIHSGKIYFEKRIVTSEDVRRIMEDVLWQEGCMASGTIVASGIEAADPHCAGTGPLKPQTPIVIDIFPVSRASHYCADMSRTVFKGEPSSGFVRMYEVVREAQEKAIGMIRVGADGAHIHAAAAGYLASRGYPTDIRGSNPHGFIHGLGHGVGIDIHEAPRLSERGDILQEGSVVTIEPGLYYSRVRKNIPAGGIRIEDMAIVRKNGCDLITRFPKDLTAMIIP